MSQNTQTESFDTLAACVHCEKVLYLNQFEQCPSCSADSDTMPYSWLESQYYQPLARVKCRDPRMPCPGLFTNKLGMTNNLKRSPQVIDLTGDEDEPSIKREKVVTFDLDFSDSADSQVTLVAPPAFQVDMVFQDDELDLFTFLAGSEAFDNLLTQS